MELTHETMSNVAGLEAELDLAEMEIASCRFGEARLRFARMTRNQRETPRALLLRARATETEDSRRLLASFVREALKRHNDPLSRSQLSAALALCGDRPGALESLPSEIGLKPEELSARNEAMDALGTVPDLPENQEHTLGAILSRKLTLDRRAR